MAELEKYDENNQNSQWNNERIDSQNQNSKAPDYSFRTEQVQGNPYQNNNQGNYYQGSSQGYPYNQPQSGSYMNNQGMNGWGNNSDNYYYGSQYNNGGYNPYGYVNNSNMNGSTRRKKEKKHGKGAKVLGFLLKAACFGIIAGASFIGFQKVYALISPATSVENVINAVENQNRYEIGMTEAATVKIVDQTAVSNVAKQTLPSIVSINGSVTKSSDFWFGQSYQSTQSGSGIIAGKTEKELLVATNNHVVEGMDTIKVTFVDGTEADAIIKGTDATADLAVVSVDISTLSKNTLDEITIAKLGNSDDVKVGELAIAIGNALGYGQSVTVGYISAKDREVEVSDGYNSKKMVLLQTDAAINPGNSGGALLNAKGEVIGINTVKYADYTVEGMGYAIPISKATPIITELMNREILSEEEQGWLGISGGDVTEQDAAAYNMPVGVFVNELTEGGAAEKAGLKKGDIIVGADDIEITSITQLKEYVNSRRVGTKVKITYMRNTNGTYEKDTLTVILGKNPSLD